MKTKLYTVMLSLFFLIGGMHAQIEKVIIERYYVSDTKDATDTAVGGRHLPVGSTTYRIYIDLMPGNKLKKIFGDVNHALKFSSTAPFFNRADDLADGDITLAKDFSKASYGFNTTALDTWITLGQTAKKQGTKYFFGVLKDQDTDGSFIGGKNNDGGSDSVIGGLLTNTTSTMGIPLTTADGMGTVAIATLGTFTTSLWPSAGFAIADSTIFSNEKISSSFVSHKAFLANSVGVKGLVPDSNQILVAQLTTIGEIAFELNIQVDVLENGVYKLHTYVANNDTLLPGEELCTMLKYPPECGCTDPNYLEYNVKYKCSKSDSCKNLAVLGCTDTMACNYNPKANVLVKSLCCYPGSCAGRDIAQVCPSVNEGSSFFNINPNPTQGNLFLNVTSGQFKEISYAIYDAFGTKVIAENLGINQQIFNKEIDLFSFNNGLYFIRVTVGDYTDSKVFMKN